MTASSEELILSPVKTNSTPKTSCNRLYNTIWCEWSTELKDNINCKLNIAIKISQNLSKSSILFMIRVLYKENLILSVFIHQNNELIGNEYCRPTVLKASQQAMITSVALRNATGQTTRSGSIGAYRNRKPRHIELYHRKQ